MYVNLGSVESVCFQSSMHTYMYFEFSHSDDRDTYASMMGSSKSKSSQDLLERCNTSITSAVEVNRDLKFKL